eukprot:177140-Pleurochrysis_carterae.AAC.3
MANCLRMLRHAWSLRAKTRSASLSSLTPCVDVRQLRVRGPISGLCAVLGAQGGNAEHAPLIALVGRCGRGDRWLQDVRGGWGSAQEWVIAGAERLFWVLGWGWWKIDGPGSGEQGRKGESV